MLPKKVVGHNVLGECSEDTEDTTTNICRRYILSNDLLLGNIAKRVLLIV